MDALGSTKPRRQEPGAAAGEKCDGARGGACSGMPCIVGRAWGRGNLKDSGRRARILEKARAPHP